VLFCNSWSGMRNTTRTSSVSVETLTFGIRYWLFVGSLDRKSQIDKRKMSSTEYFEYESLL
jgi:hypothetical protein